MMPSVALRCVSNTSLPEEPRFLEDEFHLIMQRVLSESAEPTERTCESAFAAAARSPEVCPPDLPICAGPARRPQLIDRHTAGGSTNKHELRPAQTRRGASAEETRLQAPELSVDADRRQFERAETVSGVSDRTG
jgi:hypothetical protein